MPQGLRAKPLPALETLVQRHQPEGLWLFGSWARGTASRRAGLWLRQARDDLRAGTQLLAWATEEPG